MNLCLDHRCCYTPDMSLVTVLIIILVVILVLALIGRV
jgi:hypothetical protein